MESAVRLVMPVGLVRFADRPNSYAAFVKVTYKLEAAGWAAFSVEQAPITDGERDDRGVLLPSDFSETKRACEVAVVGRNLDRFASPLRVTVGSLVLEGPTARSLAPLALGGGSKAFAGETARMPFPSLPLTVAIEGHGPTVRSAIRAPGAEMAIVVGGAWGSLQRLQPVIDAVLVDVEKRVCSVIHRAFFQHPGDPDRDIVLVVEPAGMLDERAQSEMPWWPRKTVALSEVHEDDARQTGRPPPPPPPSFPKRTHDDETTNMIQRSAILAQKSEPEAQSEEKRTAPPPPPAHDDDEEPITPRALRREQTSTFAAVTDVPATPFTRERAVVRIPPRTTQIEPRVGGETAPMVVMPFVAPTLPFARKDNEFVDEPSVAPTFGPRPSPPKRLSEESTGIIQLPVRPALPFENAPADPPTNNLADPPTDATADAAPETQAPSTKRRDFEESTALFQLPIAPRVALPFQGDVAPPPQAVSIASVHVELPAHMPRAEIREMPREIVRSTSREPRPDTTPMLSLEDYAKVRRELWAGARPRREILKSHGLSELKWRAIERKWAASIDAMAADPDKIMPVLSVLSVSATLGS